MIEETMSGAEIAINEDKDVREQRETTGLVCKVRKARDEGLMEIGCSSWSSGILQNSRLAFRRGEINENLFEKLFKTKETERILGKKTVSPKLLSGLRELQESQRG